jgi:hypothetical protein
MRRRVVVPFEESCREIVSSGQFGPTSAGMVHHCQSVLTQKYVVFSVANAYRAPAIHRPSRNASNVTP